MSVCYFYLYTLETLVFVHLLLSESSISLEHLIVRYKKYRQIVKHQALSVYFLSSSETKGKLLSHLKSFGQFSDYAFTVQQ